MSKPTMPNPPYSTRHKCPFCDAPLLWVRTQQGQALMHQTPLCLEFEVALPEDILSRVRLQEAKQVEATTA